LRIARFNLYLRRSFKMKNKIAVTIMAVLLSICFLGTGLAMEQGNKRKGKYTYRKLYKACMDRGEVASAKPTVNPDAHTQAEWEEIFDNKRFDEFGCAEEWRAVNDEDLVDIFTYLYQHASDSPTPAKCK
jgi:hypothetical protein